MAYLEPKSIIFETDNSNIVFDYDKNGGFSPSGQPKKVYGSDAVNNALSMWFESFKGEKLRDPNSGGYVRFYIQKPMSNENAKNLEEAIRSGFDQDFSPLLTIRSLVVIPNYTDNKYEIQLQVVSSTLKLEITVVEELPVQT